MVIDAIAGRITVLDLVWVEVVIVGRIIVLDHRNVVGPPEWENEAMSSVVWVKCATSAECINLSIAESTITDTLESRSHHGSTFNKTCTLSYELCTVEDGGKAIGSDRTKC